LNYNCALLVKKFGKKHFEVLMIAIALLRIPLVETPSVERCSKRNFFCKGNSRVYIELLEKKSCSFSGLFQKPTIVE
jgi:hypothetical protein